MTEGRDPKLLRLLDLEPYESISIQCKCGRSVQFPYGFLQRRHRLPSDTLIFDLQFRFRCKHCNRWKGFEISIFDERNRGVMAKEHEKTIIVPPKEWP